MHYALDQVCVGLVIYAQQTDSDKLIALLRADLTENRMTIGELLPELGLEDDAEYHQGDRLYPVERNTAYDTSEDEDET